MSQTNPEAKKKQAEDSDERQPDVLYRRRPDNITAHDIDGQQISFLSENNIELRITVHTPEIIQLKYIVEGDRPADFSYAVDPAFDPDPADYQLEEKESHFQITTDSLQCRIAKRHMKATFLNRDGDIICKDKEGFSRRDTLMKGITEVKITQEAPDGVRYFGLGDKTCDEGLRGQKFQNWNTDSYTYERGDDPLYRSIPFFSALTKETDAYGIFVDNTYRSFFDFDSKADNTCHFSAAGGYMNYYFIYGPELLTVSERYTKLTGTPDLPPMWGLGYHQCRWSYFPESRVRELAQGFRDHQIPCDAIYLDIDYMDDYRVFTWDNERFPNPQKMIVDLNEQGFKTIVMIDPGVKVDEEYDVYRQGMERDYFCKRPDGETMIAPVWPSKAVFPDYTHPDVRNWWADLHEDLIKSDGVAGFWNDMNEPAVFEISKKTFPDTIRHHFDGQPASHKKTHNIYGMQMARASYNGIKKHNKSKRPFLLTRANFSGGQRYAALWTGDNIATWDHLKLANEQCQRLSISGYSFVGSDLGGFVDDPSAELFTRWLQLGVFHPLFRNHSMGYNVDGAAAVKEEEVELQKQLSDSEQEPWTFGKKFTEINRSIIELRYCLLHYLYTAFRQYSAEGTPILRPLSFVDQHDEQAVKHIDEFMFGDKILVSPVLNRSKREVETYFPEGRWYDFRDNQLFEGKSTQIVDAPLSEIPFFIKAGTVLPLHEVMQHIGERNPDQLELKVYYGQRETTSNFYEDEGEGFSYVDDNYRMTSFCLKPDQQGKTVQLTAEREGGYTPAYNDVKISLIGFPWKPSHIRSDEKSVEFSQEENKFASTYSFVVDRDFKKIVIE